MKKILKGFVVCLLMVAIMLPSYTVATVASAEVMTDLTAQDVMLAWENSKNMPGSSTQTLSFSNVDTISSPALNTLRTQSANSGQPIMLEIDTLLQQRVLGRVIFPADLLYAPCSAQVRINGSEQAERALYKKVEQGFENDFFVVSVGHLEQTMVPAYIAVANQLPHAAPKQLYVYQLNPETGRLIPKEIMVTEKQGYLYFMGELSSCYVISNGALLLQTT